MADTYWSPPADAPAVIGVSQTRGQSALTFEDLREQVRLADELIVVPAVPRTLSGKKLELPIKRILQGMPPDRAVSRGALADPAAIDPYVEIAATRSLS